MQPCQVILAGTAPWLGKLSSSLTPLRKRQLRRVKSFLKLETAHVYIDATGAKRCVGAPSSKLTPITDCVFVLQCSIHSGIPCSVLYILESLWCEAGGKDLKATQVYPGQLGLRVHTSTSHVGQSVKPLRQVLPSIPFPCQCMHRMIQLRFFRSIGPGRSTSSPSSP